MGKKKVSDQVLIDVYAKTGNVWKVAEEVGLCGQSVHERLVRLEKNKKMNFFSDKEKKYLEKNYKKYRDKAQLNKLAVEMGRTKQFICRQAGKLGLTDQSHLRPYSEKPGVNPYSKFHARVRTLRGSPHKCEVCGEDSLKKWYDWANLTGQYEDPDDYKRMCRRCHRSYDKGRQTLVHK